MREYFGIHGLTMSSKSGVKSSQERVLTSDATGFSGQQRWNDAAVDITTTTLVE